MYSKNSRRLFLLALVVLSSPVRAQSWDHPFLWEIGGESKSYLFGTVHLPDPRLTRLPGSVNRAFETSDAVFTEIALDPSSMLAQTSHLMLSGSQSL